LASALPPSLDDTAAALKLDIRKDDEGRQLMLLMARPRQRRPGEDRNQYHWHDDDPARLARLGRYCMNDVLVERLIRARVPPLSDAEQATWILDQKINHRGFAVDVALAEAGEKIVTARLEQINQEAAEVTGGAVENISQVARIEAFVAARGHAITGMKKRNVASILEHGPGPEVERVLRLRQEGGLASAAKLGALLAGEENGRLYDTLIYHKSATGRWAGSGFQPQNLRRDGPSDEAAVIEAVLSGDLDRVAALGPVINLIASLSRSLIIAASSCDLISGDFSAIESRLTAWFAGEEWKLENYYKYDRTQIPELEPYCAVASRVLGRRVTPDDEEGRQFGKLLDLGFGFGGGVGAFTKIAPDADFSAEQIDQFKRSYRAAHPATVRFWNRLFGMLKRTVRTGETLTLGKVGAEMRDSNLCMILPSGRAITYPEARVVPGKYSEEIAFRDNAKGWQETSEWAGTFVENAVQACARDLWSRRCTASKPRVTRSCSQFMTS
jgi:DNA polymerase